LEERIIAPRVSEIRPFDGARGGIDTGITDKFDGAIIQGDYLLTQFEGVRKKHFRISTGIVIRF